MKLPCHRCLLALKSTGVSVIVLTRSHQPPILLTHGKFWPGNAGWSLDTWWWIPNVHQKLKHFVSILMIHNAKSSKIFPNLRQPGLSMKMRSSSMSFKSLDGICQRSSPCSFLSRHSNTEKHAETNCLNDDLPSKFSRNLRQIHNLERCGRWANMGRPYQTWVIQSFNAETSDGKFRFWSQHFALK